MAVAEKIWVLNEDGMPPEFDGVFDTSDYVPDEEAIKAVMEKNRALITSYGEKFAILLK